MYSVICIDNILPYVLTIAKITFSVKHKLPTIWKQYGT